MFKNNWLLFWNWNYMQWKHLHCASLHIILRFSTVQMYDHFIYIYINIHLFSFYGINTNSRLLTSSQLTWYLSWLERCTGIAEVMGSIPVQAWIFFRFLLFHRLSWKHLHCDGLHIILPLSAVQVTISSFHIYINIHLFSIYGINTNH